MRDKQYISARINEEIDKARQQYQIEYAQFDVGRRDYYDGLIHGLHTALRIMNEKPVISQDAVLTDESVEEQE